MASELLDSMGSTRYALPRQFARYYVRDVVERPRAVSDVVLFINPKINPKINPAFESLEIFSQRVK